MLAGKERYQEGCGALLEVEASDLFTQNVVADSFSVSTRTAFECPECGTVTAVCDKIPAYVEKLSKDVRPWPPKRMIRATRRRSRLDRV